MTCQFCSTDCGSINPGLPPEGSGPILLILGEHTYEADLHASHYAGSSGTLLDDLLSRLGLTRKDCTLLSAGRCLGQVTDRDYVGRHIVHATSAISFGDAALKCCYGPGALRSLRGSEQPYHKSYATDRTFVPTYALDLVRRIPTYRKVVLGDIQKAIGAHKRAEVVPYTYWTVEYAKTKTND